MAEEVPSGRVIVITGQAGVSTDLELDSLAEPEVADAIPDLLADYFAECKDWTLIAGEHWKRGRMDRVDELLQAGIRFFSGAPGRAPDPMALANLHGMLAHFHLDLARTAPKLSLQYAKYDRIPPKTRTKDYHYGEAAASLNATRDLLGRAGVSENDEPVSISLGKIMLYLAQGKPAVAHPMVDRLLAKQPNNVIALCAQARLQFAKRSHDAALTTYQKLLTIAPHMKPDPRIGLGLCLWVLGDRERARSAWQRSLVLDPSSWVSLLLIGLAALNTARDPSIPQADRLKQEALGVQSVQQAFKLNNKSPASALALASISGQGGQLPLASKLAERAIQYSDNKRHTVLANSERGRLGFMSGDVVDAGPFINAAKSEDVAGVNIIAELTLGQIAVKNGNLREALNYIEQTAKRLNGRGPLEFTVLHASLLAYPHPGMHTDEIIKNKNTARDMLSEVHNLVANASTEEDWAKLRGIASDSDIFIDLAKLWQDESLEKAIGAYGTAVGISDEDDNTLKALRTESNLGGLFHIQGNNTETAERTYQEVLQKLGEQSGKEAEVTRTTLAYNLGRAFEEGGEAAKAAQWYRDVLRQHPEHMESKVRLAMLAQEAGRNVEAHTLLKECLLSDETNLTLRSVYTHFLISIGSYKEALVFTVQNLKYDKTDIWTYVALGHIHFTLGREAKSQNDLAERTKQYLRSAEAYERALTLDPKCAIAAQGLAIALAEDSLQVKSTASVNPADEMKIRIRAAGQALNIFSRINDSLSDGSVNINMGHCYFTRGEEEKAIQSYEAASNILKGRNVPVLLYLARAWYAYANRESNFSAMSKALSYCQKAMHIQPSDRAILYNIAMIQQKAAEMLLSLEPPKRNLEELKIALEQAQHAANTFRALADDRAGALPYDADLADQRARYGDGLLRKAPEQLSKQETYEGQAAARVEQARKARAEEQRRIQAAENARKAEIEARASVIAEQRRKAREEALAWQEELQQRQIEEETKKAMKAESKKRRKEEGDQGDLEEKPRIKKGRSRRESKKSRKIRSKSEISDESDEGEEGSGGEDSREATGSGNEDFSRRRTGEEDEDDSKEARMRRKQETLAALKAKRSKGKAKREDPDDDEAVVESRRGKQFKSKAVIEDSDEEAGSLDEPRAASPAVSRDEDATPARAGSTADGTPAAASPAQENSGMDVDED